MLYYKYMKKTHEYKNYEEYVNYQLEKTNDKMKQKKWLGPEWQLKIDIFTDLFKSNIELINDKKSGLCLGSRTGQEVVAFQNLGVKEVIVIDLHEFKPYTVKGDIHSFDFENETFDLEFTNIFDHSLYPEKFSSEIFRTLKKGGIFILHVQTRKGDKYTEVEIKDIEEIEKLFQPLKLIKKNNISKKSKLIAMDVEFIFIKQ